ncbi:MAG TPA: DUF192 domain-containing protein [Dehalococcoidia bacterium]|nr:DUF192 domain-containing protein [Dehalococcoidia bacterium]
MRGVVAALIVMAGAVAIIAILALTFGAFSSAEGDDIHREPLTIVTANGTTARIQVEIADSDEERSKGLSGRTELPNDTGMLFTGLDDHRGFWMKDTLVDLSVAFIDRCGAILNVQEMQANTLDVHNTPGDYRFGLEAPEGWFARNGVAPGDIVSIPEEYRPKDC